MSGLSASPNQNNLRRTHDEDALSTALIRELRDSVEALVVETATLKERLMTLMAQRADEHDADSGSQSRAPWAAMRVYYDADGLDRLIASDPVRFSWLKDFRREFVVASQQGRQHR
jgi:hypothetical protein